MIVFLMMGSLPASGQDGIQSLQTQMSDLKSMMEEIQADLVRSRTENMALRQELEEVRQQFAALLQTNPTGEQSVEKLEEGQQLLSAKIEDQYQSKVESASRYRVKLSGLVLMNMF